MGEAQSGQTGAASSQSLNARANRTLSRGRKIYYGCLLAACVVMLYLLVGRDMRFFLVPSISMEPSFFPSDHILTLNAREYARGDVVVARDPTIPGGYVVKRVVGIGGDSLRIDGGALFLNGAYASEPYINEPMNYAFPPGAGDAGPPSYLVPDGDFFLLGDNRNFSEDSSQWPEASLPAGDIIGKVRYIYLPLRRTGAVVHYPLENAQGQ